jgi:hypothetical protein
VLYFPQPTWSQLVGGQEAAVHIRRHPHVAQLRQLPKARLAAQTVVVSGKQAPARGRASSHLAALKAAQGRRRWQRSSLACTAASALPTTPLRGLWRGRRVWRCRGPAHPAPGRQDNQLQLDASLAFTGVSPAG